MPVLVGWGAEAEGAWGRWASMGVDEVSTTERVAQRPGFGVAEIETHCLLLSAALRLSVIR